MEPDLVVKNVRSGDSVSNLKDKIQISTGIHRMNQILRYGTWIYLDDSFSLAAYGIFNDTTLTLIDNSPMTIPSNRKRESTSTDGTSKALKSSASMSVKSTSASESQVISNNLSFVYIAFPVDRFVTDRGTGFFEYYQA